LFKYLDGLQEPVLGVVLAEDLVKAAAVDDEQNGGGAVEDADPLPTLSLLSSNVKNTKIIILWHKQ
jgi:hypothetical protein